MENPTNTPSAAQQAENNGSERMFSQSELNTIVADRLARERSKSAERVGDLDAREKDLKAREEALEARVSVSTSGKPGKPAVSIWLITISARRCWISWTRPTRKRSRPL